MCIRDRGARAVADALLGRAPTLPTAGGVATERAPDWTGAEAEDRERKMCAHIEKMIRRPARRSAPGPMASRPEHWEVLKYTSDRVQRMARLVVALALGRVPKSVVRGHSTGEIIAIPKPNGGIRPPIMSSVLRRMGLAGVARAIGTAAWAASGPYQLGVDTSDGCAKAFHSIGALARLRPDKALMAADVTAAHQSLDRDFMRKEVPERCPTMDRPLDVWYPPDEPTRH